MAYKVVDCDNIRETFTGANSTTITLGGAAQYSRALSAKLASGDTFYGAARAGAEIAVGKFTYNGATVAQTAIRYSSNSNNPVTFSSGAAGEIFVDLIAGQADTLYLEEITVTSAATMDIGAVDGLRIASSGTTGPVTSLGAIANKIRIVRWSGQTITHHATSLILRGGVSRTTVANDIGIYVSDASGNWREIVYQDASGLYVWAGAAQALTATQQGLARNNIYAAPFDALAYNGMQLNGAMEVSQESVAAAISIGTGTVNKNLLDGNRISKTGTSVLTAQQITSTITGFQKSLKFTVTTAQASIGSDFVLLEFPIEAYRFSRCNPGTAGAISITVGFWVKAPVAGDYQIRITNNSDASTYGLFTVAVANTAEFKTVTLAVPTTGTWLAGSNLGAIFGIYLASTGYQNAVGNTSYVFEITGLVILPGIEAPSSAMLPRILRPFPQELLLCQRQYEKSYDHGTALGALTTAGCIVKVTLNNLPAAVYTNSATENFEVRKRAAPTVTAYSPVTGASGKVRDLFNSADITPSIDYIGERGFRIVSTSSASVAGVGFNAHFVADARL